MNILITGGAGFVGYSITKFLLEKSKNNIYSIDNLNNYYSVKLKKSRVKELKKFKKFNFKKIDICSRKKIDNYIKKNKISFIIHLAAQAGVSYSLKNPNSYFYRHTAPGVPRKFDSSEPWTKKEEELFQQPGYFLL